MEQKLNVADFATLVGTTSKKKKQKILNNSELPVNEQLRTVKEKIKGRETTLILTNSEQIEFYKKLYGKQQVNNGEYYETLTYNNGNKQVNNPANNENNLDNNHFSDDIFEKFLTVNKDFNNRYEQKITELIEVHNELAEVKGRQLLLEDKAGREGLYLNEINELKKDNNHLKIVIYSLITVLVILLLGLTVYITYNVTVNNSYTKVNEQVNRNSDQTNVQTDIKKTAQKKSVPRSD